jgi:hypothetical protein
LPFGITKRYLAIAALALVLTLGFAWIQPKAL